MAENNHRMLIQVVGPYRSKTINQVYENVALARKAAIAIFRRGHYAITPHTNTAFMDGVVPDERFLALALLLIEHVDAVLLLPGWTNSRGSEAEKLKAERLGKRIFFGIDQVPPFVREGLI